MSEDNNNNSNSDPIGSSVFSKLDPAFLAYSRLRRRKLDSAIDLCTELLAKTPLDRASWFIKTRALTLKTYIDDIDMEEEGLAELLMDENSMQKAPRPGTSLKRPQTNSSGPDPNNPSSLLSGGINPNIRPMSSSGRPLSGFARPGTQSRPNNNNSIESALSGARPGTSRPISVAGRNIRLGTQSMLLTSGDQFIDANRIDVTKFANKPAEAKALIDYLLYHDHNPRKALELASECTKIAEYKDWFWKSRLGKCYYQLGMLREAERQYKSAINHQDMITTYLELSKIYLRLDQPNQALDNYMRASEKYQGDITLILGIARVYDQLNDKHISNED